MDLAYLRDHTSSPYLVGPNGFYLRDLESLNGTYVNRDLVDECVLKHGDEVQIGKFKLSYLER